MADPFVEGGYASIKGLVRTYVLTLNCCGTSPTRRRLSSTLEAGRRISRCRWSVRCAAARGSAGVVSVMALNARTLAVRPARDGRWADALAAFDATREVGVLGSDTRGDTVERLSALLQESEVDPETWYGVWLFTDWLDVPPDSTDVAAVGAVEFEASGRDPYRQLSRLFHLIGRRTPAPRS